MHVFLTGERVVGKSTLVRAVMRRMGGPCKGFVTRFVSDARGAGPLYLSPADAPMMTDEAHVAATPENGRMRARTACFDTVGAAILREARETQPRLIVMDECGHLEKDALVFQREIAACLDGDTPVLGVLRRDQAWHAFIRSHPAVTVLTVTPENRERLADEIIGLLERSAPHGGTDA